MHLKEKNFSVFTMFHVASFWWGHSFSSFIYSSNITRCFTGPTWPSFVLISLAEYLTKRCDLLQQLLSPVWENQVWAPSLDKIPCCNSLMLIRVITPHWRRNTIYFLKEQSWCLGEVNSFLWKTAKNPNSHLTSPRVRMSPP